AIVQHALEHLEAVDIGQTPVEHHDVVALGFPCAQARLAAGRGGDLVTLGIERFFGDDAERLLVVDDKHARLHASTVLPKRRCASTSMGGRSTRDRMARISAPPMTTMASGFWVWAPMPFEIAAGKRPTIATSVVMSTGRKRFSAAIAAPSSSDFPSAHSRCA